MAPELPESLACRTYNPGARLENINSSVKEYTVEVCFMSVWSGFDRDQDEVAFGQLFLRWTFKVLGIEYL